MAAARVAVVVGDAHADTPAVGDLFEGISFFLVQRIPQRGLFVQKIESNGGRVVKLETQADHIIADHVRRDCPPASLSYRFIDAALATGSLPDPNDHLAGPPAGTIRETTSARPAKSTRTPFTAEDDVVLWNWVQNSTIGTVKGNMLYQDLERANPRHTYQAWRDRYIKKLMDKPPSGAGVAPSANAQPIPTVAQVEQPEVAAEPSSQHANGERANTTDEQTRAEAIASEGATQNQTTAKDGATAPVAPSKVEFSDEDRALLLAHGEGIMNIHPTQQKAAWKKWAAIHSRHSANAWYDLWHQELLQIYQDQLVDEQSDENESRGEESTSNRSTLFVSQTKSGSRSSPNRKRERQEVNDEDIGSRKSPRVDVVETAHQLRSVEASAQPTIANASGLISSHSIEILASDGPSDAEQEDEQSTPSSELNEQAQMQLENEVAATQRPNQDAGDASTSNFPTSDAIGAADEQLRGESASEHSDESEMEARTNAQPTLPVTQEGDPAASRTAVQAALERQAANRGLLTEENLATHQTQHNNISLRGTDLPEDDENKDGELQEQYLRFLQDVTKSPDAPEHPSSSRAAQIPVNPAVRAGEMTVQLQSSAEVIDLGDDPLDGIPMSSQQEIEEAFEEAMAWPYSPGKQMRNDSPSQDLRLETQIVYPDLSLGRSENFERHGEQPLTGTLRYPTLPEQPYVDLFEDAQSQPIAAPSLQGTSSELGAIVKINSNLTDDREGDLPESAEQEVEEVEIHLSIPEPAEGWQLSSPSRHVASQAAGTMYNRTIREEAQGSLHADRDDGHEMNEVSSDTSASSPSSQESAVANNSREGQRALETQDILNAETQRLDFDIPLPEDSEDEDSAHEDLPTDPFAPPPVWPPKWSKFEDASVIQGVADGLSAHEIINAYGLKRSTNSLRNRRKVLEERFVREPTVSSHGRDNEELVSNPYDTPPPPLNSATAESQRNLPNTQRIDDDEVDAYIDKMMVFGHEEGAIIDALKRASMRPDLAELILLEAKAGKGMPSDIAGIWSSEEDALLESGNARGLKRLEEKHTWKECEERMEFLQALRDE